MEVPYYRAKGRGDLYLVVGKKGEWRGVFQGNYSCESGNWILVFSNKNGLRDFTQNEKYFLLETKKESDQRKMERRALLLILRKITGNPYFMTDL